MRENLVGMSERILAVLNRSGKTFSCRNMPHWEVGVGGVGSSENYMHSMGSVNRLRKHA